MPDPGEKPRVYVNAILCESTIREEDSRLLTAIRINDGYAVKPAALTLRNQDGTLDAGNPQIFHRPLGINLVITLRSDAPVTFVFNIKGFRPGGIPLQSLFQPLDMAIGSSVEGGHTLNVRLTVPTDEQGDFWFEFYVDSGLATKIPMRITHSAEFVSLDASKPAESPQTESTSGRT